MSLYNQDEKRQAERIATERPVKIFISDETVVAKMIDISIMGAGILSPQDCMEDNLIEVEFNLPSMGAKALRMEARVVHIAQVRGECLMGLRFDPEVKSNQIAIGEYIRYHNRQLR